MAPLSPSDLLKLAQTQLSSTAFAPVPPAYLTELKNHLALYPYDTLFRVTLQPKKGLGFVTCLENGCDRLPITLTKRASVPDGGHSEGLGSLSAYRTHVQQHATHRDNRRARLRSGESNSATTPPKPLIGKEEASTINPQPTKFLVTPSKSTNLEGVKPEPADSSILRKRLSDSAFGIDPKASVSLKKPKTEDEENTKPVPALAVNVADIRAQIDSLQQQISHKQQLWDRIQRKKHKSKADMTRLKTQGDELARLRKLKAEYDASLPRAASPIKRTASLVKAESISKLLPPAPTGKIKSESSGNPFLPLPTIKDEVKTSRPNLMLDVKPTVPVPGPTPASSSKFPGAWDSDDDMVVDPVITLNKVAHAIPNIAPLGGYDGRDENGDFHGRGRDMFQGPQAKADDIDKFLIEAGNVELFDGNATIEGVLVKLGLESTHELLPSLDIPLMPHQLLGVAWMVEKEKNKSFQGGILADEMGLGKTVQMIATMAKNPSQDPNCKTTLIITPLALLVQWNQEIATKVNAEWKVLIYHGSNKPRKKADLLKYDVVLTTYTTMAMEWPDYEAEEKKKAKAKKKKPADDFIASDSDDSGSDGPRNKTKLKKARGLLFQVDFYRIVLDEAQNIRNKRTRVSRAVTDLTSIYRWCLTATPIVNGLVDAYGPIRFLRMRPWYDWSEYNSQIARYEKKNPQLAVTRLQAIFNTFLMRRMKTSELDGKKLIELPEKIMDLVSLSFSQEERDIYNQVETAQQAKFNRYLRAGTVLKNYASVLVLLLRLRQLCSHPSLIQENGSHFLAPDEANDLEEYRDELSRARTIVGPDFVKKMKQKYRDVALRRIEAEKESADAVVEEDDCPICFDALTEAVVTSCGHEFCKDCITNVLEAPSGEDKNGLKADERPCPACRSTISPAKLFSTAAFEPRDEELAKEEDMSDIEILDAKPASKGKSKNKAKRPARKTASKMVVLDSSDIEEQSESDYDSDLKDFIVQSDEDEEEKDVRLQMKKRLGKRKAITIIDSDSDSDEDMIETPEEKEVLFGARKKKLTKEEIKLMPHFLPSTKMKEMMKYLKDLALEHPDEKTLIISQWTGCLTIVSDYLTEAGIVHVKYQGDMTNAKREQAVQVFMSKDKARVMLMSLKCGGVGLNLTRANNVISLDLGWSPAIDQQAFDRVHRLGQNRKVTVKRLVIENTVEDRILALQERKKNLADGSLGEGNGKKIGRLSVRELANLFGLDARGRVLAKD